MPNSVQSYKIPQGTAPLSYLLEKLYELNLSTLMVEGGIQTLQMFIDAGLWDEALVLTAGGYLPSGRRSPDLPVPPESVQPVGTDTLRRFYPGPIR